MKIRNRLLALLLAVVLCLPIFFQIATPVQAASFSSPYLTRLANHSNTYGVNDSNGKGKMLIQYETSGNYEYYFVLRNQSNGLYFDFLISSSSSTRIISNTEFVLTESSNYITVDFDMLYYYQNVYQDSVSASKSVNKTTYKSTSTYTLTQRGSYISSADATKQFNLTLQLLCSYWDRYIYNNLGFGLKAIGFTSYDGLGSLPCTSHSYSNACDTSCNTCGATRSVTHAYSASCDENCDICGATRSATSSHTYSYSCSTACNVCGATRASAGSHTYDNNQDTTCNYCGYTRQVAQEDSSAVLHSGKCGSNVTWKLTESGTLIISGTGNMYSYESDTQPWKEYRSSIKQIQVMPGVTSIGNYAFYYFRYLEEVYIADTVNTLGRNCFSSCTSLREITIPEGVKAMPKFAFDSCSGLEVINIPSTVTSFNQSCFEDCSSLQYFIIPDGTTAIAYGMFWGCTSLQYVQIPKSVTEIDTFAFHECDNLSDIYYTGTQSQYSAIDISSLQNYNEGLLHATVHYSTKAPCITCTFGKYTKVDETYHSHACTNCGKTEQAEHTWDNGTVTVVPTENTTGTRVYRCTACTASKSETIPVRSGCDYNGDFALTDADAVYLLRYTLFPDSYPITQDGDVNNDGIVTDADAVYLLRHTLFPDSYPLFP